MDPIGEIDSEQDHARALARLHTTSGPLVLAEQGKIEMDEAERQIRRGVVDTLAAALAEYEQRNHQAFRMTDHRKIIWEGVGIGTRT